MASLKYKINFTQVLHRFLEFGPILNYMSPYEKKNR